MTEDIESPYETIKQKNDYIMMMRNNHEIEIKKHEERETQLIQDKSLLQQQNKDLQSGLDETLLKVQVLEYMMEKDKELIYIYHYENEQLKESTLFDEQLAEANAEIERQRKFKINYLRRMNTYKRKHKGSKKELKRIKKAASVISDMLIGDYIHREEQKYTDDDNSTNG